MHPEEDEELIDFGEAMHNFCSMFPHLEAEQIEDVLRKYDGDVSSTVNELLFDTSSSDSQLYLPTGQNKLFVLRIRRNEISEKLQTIQKLLDNVVDVDMAREYEDQQLALLLEYREVTELIKEEKTKSIQTFSNQKLVKSSNIKRNIKKKVKESAKNKKLERCPNGPYVGENTETSNSLWATLEKIRKTSMSKISKLFTAG